EAGGDGRGGEGGWLGRSRESISARATSRSSFRRRTWHRSSRGSFNHPAPEPIGYAPPRIAQLNIPLKGFNKAGFWYNANSSASVFRSLRPCSLGIRPACSEDGHC